MGLKYKTVSYVESGNELLKRRGWFSQERPPSKLPCGSVAVVYWSGHEYKAGLSCQLVPLYGDGY